MVSMVGMVSMISMVSLVKMISMHSMHSMHSEGKRVTECTIYNSMLIQHTCSIMVQQQVLAAVTLDKVTQIQMHCTYLLATL